MSENYREFFLNKYQKTYLTKQEVAIELGLSVRTVDKRVNECRDIPKYKKMGRKTIFPINEVAKFLETGLIEVYVEGMR